MKKMHYILFLPIFFIAGYNSYSKENLTEKASVYLVDNFENDSIKIMKVINDEYKAYFIKDYEAWAENFVHADYLKYWGFWEGYPEKVRQYNSWNELRINKKKRMDGEIKAYWDENQPGMDIRNLDIQIRGDVAWVTFKQRSTDQETGEFLGEALETKIMEKINGEWKIAYLNFLYLPMNGKSE